MVSPLLFAQSNATATANPKVRAITGFVRLEQGTWDRQVAETLTVLRKVKSEFEASGYQVESLRVTTQPLGEFQDPFLINTTLHPLP